MNKLLHPEIEIVDYNKIMTEKEFQASILSDNRSNFKLGDAVNITHEQNEENKKYIRSRIGDKKKK